jgi:hypothetical protein
MIPLAIFLFLVGAVLAWGFRVWILVPATILTIFVTVIFELAVGEGLFMAIGYGVLVGFAPQTGYAFGLVARSTLLAVRSPLVPRSSRSASVATLYRQRSVNPPR